MIITILQENLLPSLTDALRFIAGKPQLPILSGVHIQATAQGIFIRSTDLKVGFQAKVGGKIEGEGECVVPARYFCETIASLTQGAIRLESTQTHLLVSQGKISAKLSLFPPDDFPPFPDRGEEVFVLDREEFFHAVDAVSYAASQDESRPVLGSVLLKTQDKLCTVVATDGYRLSMNRFQHSKELPKMDILIQAKMLSEMGRIIGKQTESDVHFFVSQELSQVGVQCGDVMILIRKTDGEYPNYNAIIPDSFTTQIEIDRESLLHALKTALVFAKEMSSIVSLSFTKNLLTVTGSNTTVGENTITIDVKNDTEGEQKISCNARFLTDALMHGESTFVTIGMNEELRPVGLWIDEKKDYLYIVMPFKR